MTHSDTMGRRSVLDFGCGCGRTLVWMLRRFSQADYWGIDVDAEAIDWCRDHLAPAQFAVNTVVPPPSFADASFDFVYAISVFTHLDSCAQTAWVQELARILRPGAVALFTFYGEMASGCLKPAQRAEFAENGHVFCTSVRNHGILPDWYHTAFYTPGFIEASLSRHFRVLARCPGAMGVQDAVLLARA